jgi:hypothetical protein
MMLIELFACSSPVVVTVTRNCPFTGVTITSDFAADAGNEKNQMMQTTRRAAAAYVTAGRRVNRERSAGGKNAVNREYPGRRGMGSP